MGDVKPVAVQMVTISLEVPKEMNDVREALMGLVVDIKAKKSIGEMAANAFPKFVAAVEGVDQLDDAVREKMKSSSALIGLTAGEAIGTMLEKTAKDGEPV